MRQSSSGFTLLEALVVLAVVLVFAAALFPTGIFVNERIAVRALEDQGFSKVQVTDRAIWFIGFRGGEHSDAVRFTRTGLNPLGRRVTTHVFSGWLWKGATIRTIND